MGLGVGDEPNNLFLPRAQLILKPSRGNPDSPGSAAEASGQAEGSKWGHGVPPSAYHICQRSSWQLHRPLVHTSYTYRSERLENMGTVQSGE